MFGLNLQISRQMNTIFPSQHPDSEMTFIVPGVKLNSLNQSV